MATKGVKINLQDDVFACWESARRGYPHTIFAMACLGAFMSLTERDKAALMPKVGYVDEKHKGWDRVLEWAREMCAAADDEEAAGEADAPTRKGSRVKRSGGGR